MKRTRGAIILACVLALAAAGCGDDDDSDQFREDYNAAVDKLSQINSDIAAAGSESGQTNSEIAEQFDDIAETAAQTRTDLAELDPPDDAKEEFDDLLSALKSGVADLRAVAAAVKDNDADATRQAVEDLSQSGEEISTAEDDLKDAVDG